LPWFDFFKGYYQMQGGIIKMDSRIKVLMVDDEAQFRATTQKILERKGFETILAATGPEALEKLSMNPDVVVLDINMPGMDGHETLERMKAIQPDLPVIMLTGHGGLPSAKSALTQGAFDYLAKPCDVSLLAMKIRTAHRMRSKESPSKERTVLEVMVPIEEYTVLSADRTVREAIQALKASFASKVTTSRLMETGHRSILVLENNQLVGLLAINDLLEALLPLYLFAPKPSTADSMQYSPMFWKGLFNDQVLQMADKQIQSIMSPAPMAIDAGSNLMEAAYIMLENNARRLAVFFDGTLAGIIREQDLFFEMDRVLEE
jgi:DNA-binding response OmpR family regulator